MLNSKRILARGDIAAVALIALAQWVTLALRRSPASRIYYRDCALVDWNSSNDNLSLERTIQK